MSEFWSRWLRELPAPLIALLAVAIAGYFAYRSTLTRREEARHFSLPLPDQCHVNADSKGGREVLSEPTIKVSGSNLVQCYAPATGQLLQRINPVTSDGIDRVIDKARKAQIEWSKTQFWQRRQVLRTLLRFILANQDDIVKVACLDSGKTKVDALFGEILVTVEKLKWTIDHGEQSLRSERRPTNFLMFYKKNTVVFEPLGVIAACVSWNYPFHNVLGPVISALFAGNAIIVKNSEQTAWSSIYFADMMRKALGVCGHDPDLVHTITCWPDTANHLTSHPSVSHLTFIGSKPVAHEVAKSAAKSLIPLCVELGGKDAAVVLDHPTGIRTSQPEMERVASIIMRGVFQSAGQNCIGIERVVAMPKAYDRLIAMLEPRIRKLRVGNDLDAADGGSIDVGAMISAASFTRLENLITDAVAQGARLVTGGKKLNHPKFPSGHYFEPTMLIDVTPTMRIAQEELFGPICVFMRAESVQDAVSVVNGTIYGLGCSVFGPTDSASRAQLDMVAAQVNTGMVAINDFAVFYAVQLPFGGVRGSGYGRFAGQEGLRSVCNMKSICTDRFPSLIKTAIPAKLDYPMQRDSFNMARGIVEVGYGDSLGRMWTGMLRLVGHVKAG